MKRSILILSLLALPVLSGCLATLDGKFDNRLACTVAGDKLYALSEYGPIGISARISDLDRAVVCRASEQAKEPAVRAPSAPASAASGAK